MVKVLTKYIVSQLRVQFPFLGYHESFRLTTSVFFIKLYMCEIKHGNDGEIWISPFHHVTVFPDLLH